MIFDRVVTKKTPGQFRTRVIRDGVHPSLHIDYKNFDLKQYFKEGRGCRTEGTFRNPNDFGVNKGLSHLPNLQKIGREINRRLLEVERVSHNSGLSGGSIQRVGQPTVTNDGEKAPALKFGQPRVMALFLALTLFQQLIDGLRNRDLRAQVPPKTHRYFLTPYGWKSPGSSLVWRPGCSVPPAPCSPATTPYCHSHYRLRSIAWTRISMNRSTKPSRRRRHLETSKTCYVR